MISMFNTEYGIINYNSNLLMQLVSEATRDYEGKVKIFPIKKKIVSDKGLYVEVNLNLAFGESISGVSRKIIDYLNDAIINSFEMPVDNIVVTVENLVTKNQNLVKRNIVTKLHD